MALNGINVALAFTAQEEIWHRIYTKLNLTDIEIQEHFTGPSFLAWYSIFFIYCWKSCVTSLLKKDLNVINDKTKVGEVVLVCQRFVTS